MTDFGILGFWASERIFFDSYSLNSQNPKCSVFRKQKLLMGWRSGSTHTHINRKKFKHQIRTKDKKDKVQKGERAKKNKLRN